MFLKIKALKLFAGRPVAIISKKTAKQLNVHVDERLGIKAKNKQVISIVDTAMFIPEKEIILSQEIINTLKLKSGQFVEVMSIEQPQSAYYIREKIKGCRLSEEKILCIISDIVSNKLTEAEIAYFVSAVYINRMDMEETFSLIKAIVSTGKKLKIDGKKIIADKHSIGGIAGNRTTPIVVPICAAAGLTMPKTSSRAITSAAGTADVIETIARIEFSVQQIKNIIKKVNACMVWGGALGLAPADDKIIQVERLLSLDPEAQLIASILSKKVAAGATHIVLDIPCGKSAKFSFKEAKELGKKFEYLAKKLGIRLKVYVSDGSQPIGNGIGPVLEMKDVISVLSREKNCPKDLENKSLELAAILLELTKKAKPGKGIAMAKNILESGEALKKFKEIVKIQNNSQNNFAKKLVLGKYSHSIKSGRGGKIIEIDNKKMNSIAKVAGCPTDKGSGLYLWKHCKDSIKENEVITTIYAENKEKLEYAKRKYIELKPILID
jgi:AMP phosphorylase